MPLSEKARIEAYLPDLPRPAYQDLLAVLEQEFTYSFGGWTTLRGLEGNNSSRLGPVTRDRINLIYTDTPFLCEQHFTILAGYADEVRRAAYNALEEEAILIAVLKAYHSE